MALLTTTRPQESIHDPAVQITKLDMLFSQPPTEIGDCYDLPSDRVARVALFGDRGCIGIEVFTQRPLAKAFNRTWEREELVYHSSRVPAGCRKLCRIDAAGIPAIGCQHFNTRHSPGSGIVSETVRVGNFDAGGPTMMAKQ